MTHPRGRAHLALPLSVVMMDAVETFCCWIVALGFLLICAGCAIAAALR